MEFLELYDLAQIMIIFGYLFVSLSAAAAGWKEEVCASGIRRRRLLDDYESRIIVHSCP